MMTRIGFLFNRALNMLKIKGFILGLASSMKPTTCMAEALKYGVMVPASVLATGRMALCGLATTSPYTVMVTSKWERYTLKKVRD